MEVRFLLPSGAPVVKTYTVPAGSRFNVWVNTIPELASTDCSAVITATNGVPIIVERAMYLDGADGLAFGAGHESAGVTAPAMAWFLAEGATGPYFDLFVLVANPGTTAAEVEATYLLPDGTTVVKPYTVAADEPVQHLGGLRGRAAGGHGGVDDGAGRPTGCRCWWSGRCGGRGRGGTRRTTRSGRRRRGRCGRWGRGR